MRNLTWTLNFSQLASWFGAISAVIFVGILASNILVLATFKRIKSLTTLHHFMIGLSVADLVTALPYSIVIFTTANGSIRLTQALCDIWGVMFVVTIATTTWIHSAMQVEKCISILHPISHRNFQKTKNAVYLTRGIIVMGLVLPTMVCTILLKLDVMNIVFLPYVPGCVYDSDIRIYAVVGWLYIIAPMITQVVYHVLILKAVRATGRRLGDVQQRAQKPNLRVMKTISITLGSYYACWFPLIVQMIWNSVQQSPEWCDAVIVHTLVANSGLSFIIYTSGLPTFQQQVKKTLLKCLAGGNRVAS